MIRINLLAVERDRGKKKAVTFGTGQKLTIGCSIKAQLQQRVVLIEQLRKGQTGPVHMLDQLSRALPSMLWLTSLKQTGTDVIVDGKCTTLTGLSEFVSNLEASGYFKRSVEIVSTASDAPTSTAGNELIRFTIKAVFQVPGETAPAAAPAKAGN